MTVYNRGLEADLNSILTIGGVVKASLWPFWESAGVLVSGIGAGDLIPSETAGAAEALEDTAAPLTIGCSGVTATPVNEFHGRLALPFLFGKELTPAEVKSLYETTVPMVGLA